MKDFWIKNVFPNLKDNILYLWLNICNISAWNDENFIKQMIGMSTLRSRDFIIWMLPWPIILQKKLPRIKLYEQLTLIISPTQTQAFVSEQDPIGPLQFTF